MLLQSSTQATTSHRAASRQKILARAALGARRLWVFSRGNCSLCGSSADERIRGSRALEQRMSKRQPRRRASPAPPASHMVNFTVAGRGPAAPPRAGGHAHGRDLRSGRSQRDCARHLRALLASCELWRPGAVHLAPLVAWRCARAICRGRSAHKSESGAWNGPREISEEI